MRGWGPVLLGAMLLPTASAAWYQDSHDAARSALDESAGPLTDDIAFRVRIPALLFSPLIFDGHVYVQGGGVPAIDPNAVESGIWRVRLADARVEKIVALDELPFGLAADEERLYIAIRHEMRAYSHDGATLLWATPWPRSGNAENARCGNVRLAVVGPTIFVACTFIESRAGIDLPADAIVVQFDAASGALGWTWRRSAEEPSAPSDPSPERLAQTATAPSNFTASFLAVASETVIVTLAEQTRSSEATRFVPPLPDAPGAAANVQRVSAVGIDATSGSRRWTYEGARGHSASQTAAAEIPSPSQFPEIIGQASIFDNIAYIPADQLHAVNPISGDTIWSADTGAADPTDAAGGASVAGDARALFTASLQSLYRIDPVQHSEIWRRTLAETEIKLWGQQPIVIAGDHLYARATVMTEALQQLPVDVIYCYDYDGNLVWQRRMPRTDPPREVMPAGFRHAVGDGVLLVSGQDGTITIFGTTAAALLPRPLATTLYPPVGGSFTLDLSDVTPGAFGPATEYRVEWSDGDVSDWQPSPIFSHAYATAGDRVVRAQVRNAAEQSASAFLTVHVGAQAPVPLTTIQRAFAPDYQNWTFFFLGLVATAVGGAVGVYRIRAKRHVLQRELRQLDHEYVRLKDKPAECEAMLAEARVRARGLLISGKFEESHFAVLDLRITELGRGLRLSVLDARFDHLPHGMVKTIREMLEDGRIGRVEREHFLTLLERDVLLTQEQRTRIRALVDEWFMADSSTSP